jgi:hypothetical protein
VERPKFLLLHLEGEVVAIITIRIDLAKNVFAVDGVDETSPITRLKA